MAETENAPVRSFAVEDIARVCHDTIRAIQAITGDPLPAPPWESAGQEMRESAIASVQAVLGGADAGELHAAWCRGKAAAGWRRGEFKNPEARTHPDLVPFADLPWSAQVKDRVFVSVVKAMSGEEASSFTEWAVFWGGEDPNDCAGWNGYDDEADAEEHREWIVGGGVGRRTVTRGRWTVTVPAPPAERGLLGDWSDEELAEFRRWREQKGECNA